MVVKRQCSFCMSEIEPGTGLMYVKRDGTIFHFCSTSCRKQQIDLGRVGHRTKWTRAHELKLAQSRSVAASRATTESKGEPAESGPSAPSTEEAAAPTPAKKPRAAKAARAPRTT